MIPVFMTAAPRDWSIHSRCIQSIYRSGFEKLTICCEPHTVLWGLASRARVIQHSRRMGQWQNFICALRAGLCSRSRYFVTCEDDIVFCRDVAQLIEHLPWPSERCGVVQLYSSAAYSEYPAGRSMLTVPHALDMLSACALLWRHDAAELVVDCPWRGDSYVESEDLERNPQKKKDADTFVGETLTKMNREVWIHNPSLADHIGDQSTLGHRTVSDRRRPLNWQGEDVSAFDLMKGLQCV